MTNTALQTSRRGLSYSTSTTKYLRSLHKCDCGNLLDSIDTRCDRCGHDKGAYRAERYIIDERGRLVTMRDLARRYRIETLPRTGVRRSL